MNGETDFFEVQPGEKFACLVFSAFDLRRLNGPGTVALGNGCWLSDEVPARLPFPLDEWWRCQLGEFVIDQLERWSNFVLLVKQPSLRPKILDDENHLLSRRVEFLLWGLTMSAGVPTFGFDRLISGGVGNDGSRIGVGAMQPFYRSGGLGNPEAGADDLRRATSFVERIQEIFRQKQRDRKLYWRIASGFNALRLGVCSPDAEVRLHQFVRAIESFLPPSVWGQDDFARRVSILMRSPDDPTTSELLKEIYRLRNKAEHHEHFEEAMLSGSVPEETANRRLRQAEALCRELYRRFFMGDPDFLTVYRDTGTIEDLWSDHAIVHAKWGTPFDLQAIR